MAVRSGLFHFSPPCSSFSWWDGCWVLFDGGGSVFFHSFFLDPGGRSVKLSKGLWGCFGPKLGGSATGSPWWVRERRFVSGLVNRHSSVSVASRTKPVSFQGLGLAIDLLIVGLVFSSN
ncbi:unnamed protein product [Brassica oleracea]|uniref:(rape) hypothetical protein n=1 Tax=Brassica napus TaxID=3708 RepID=A0A816KUN9_BRANA|nr:unnamed protein product [Brassica napus]